jgi:large subunit ribosomal protein L35
VPQRSLSRARAVYRSRERVMPKMKTHSGAKKRFSVTGSGKVRRLKAYKSHILTKMSSKKKRDLRRPTIVTTNGEVKRIKRLLVA